LTFYMKSCFITKMRVFISQVHVFLSKNAHFLTIFLQTHALQVLIYHSVASSVHLCECTGGVSMYQNGVSSARCGTVHL
jgi:hypothetical protein